MASITETTIQRRISLLNIGSYMTQVNRVGLSSMSCAVVEPLFDGSTDPTIMQSVNNSEMIRSRGIFILET
jgi:hypothetical protein